MPRSGKQLHSPRFGALLSAVPDNLDAHPKRSELLGILRKYLRKDALSDALPAYASAVNMFDSARVLAAKLPTASEEREDLANLIDAIKNLQKRLEHFPPRAEGEA